jgi:hypothetical protein
MEQRPECSVRFGVGGQILYAKENCKEAVLLILDEDEKKAALFANAGTPAMIAAAATVIGALNHHLKCRTPNDLCRFHAKLLAIQYDLEGLLAGGQPLEDDSVHDDHE